MLRTISHFLSLIRFSHTVFALPFALLSAVLAWWLRAIEHPYALTAIEQRWRRLSPQGWWIQLGGVSFGPFAWTSTEETGLRDFFHAVRWQEVLGILLCMIFARSAAMAFNRLVDRRFDAANPRTATRHLPAGVLSVGTVTLFTVVSAIGFVMSTYFFYPNTLPTFLSLPVLAFLLGYSYAKRFTMYAHFWLGIALALSPLAAWIAIRGAEVLANPFDLLPALVLAGAVATWVTGFDIIYACQDSDFDRAAGLHSIPSRLGVVGGLRVAALCHTLTVLLLAALPLVYPPLGTIYLVGIAAVALLLVYEHWLVRPTDLARVNLAFFNVNAVISLGLLAVSVVDLLV